MTDQVVHLDIHVSTETYPLDVIHRTCYQFTDRYYVWLSPKPDAVLVRFSPKKEGELPDSLEGEFGNALIDQAVRSTVAKETAEVRQKLVETAFSEALGTKK